MGDIINISSIHDYNEFLGIETLNPLITLIDFRQVKVLKHKKKLYGFYGIYLKEKIHGKLTYGRSQYDYQEGTSWLPDKWQVLTTAVKRPIPKAIVCCSIPTCCEAQALPAR